MMEHASTTKEPVNSVALAHQDILVNAVMPIDVIFMNVKTKGHVLSIL